MSATELLSRQDRILLLDMARASIRSGLSERRAMTINPADYSETLQPLRATFITLKLDGQLRGCIGSLSAYQPLVQDVAAHAYAAAFNDPRFPPLSAAELPHLEVHISILSPPTPLWFTSEEDLLAQLRPGQDGLILQFQHHRATFLPAVWESLPDPQSFLAHLKQKAGLSPNFWSPELRVDRYITESFGDADVVEIAG